MRGGVDRRSVLVSDAPRGRCSRDRRPSGRPVGGIEEASLETCDFLVVGGGVIGVGIARELRARNPGSSVILLEKESLLGTHASGRNSGVLHAGFYYTPDSLKAKLTREGNRLLTEYCVDRGLRINRCGKLVVCRNEAELGPLDELARRGRANGVVLESVTREEARRIEPRARTFERALWSPTTASVDPSEVMASLARDAASEGIRIRPGERYVGKDARIVRTTKSAYEAGYVVNAAGLYADRVARDFGFSRHYRMLPFKGIYLYSDEPPGSLRVHVYPVPDLRNPFLGVHYTITVDGRNKIGPTAIPAFWREQYGLLERFSLPEAIETLVRQAGLIFSADFDFRGLALREIRKYSKAFMVREAASLVDGADVRHFSSWGKPGIRAQLLDIRTRKLEMDFVMEGDDHSMHVLNAVSPAFTCSIPFSRLVCDEIESRCGSRPKESGNAHSGHR